MRGAHRYRTGRLLFTLAQRLNKHTGRLGQFHAWNKCLGHILALARAHIESVMYDHFIEGVNKCTDADCRKSLKVLAIPQPPNGYGREMPVSASRFKQLV